MKSISVIQASIVSLLILFLASFNVLCQPVQGNPADLFSRKLSLPELSSPTEWSFYKYLEHPVSLYHGQPDVSIDLYTLKDGEIEIPLRLRYNTSGIKVEEEASWVGLGWNLEVGGYIKRIVIGGDDDRDILYNSYKSLFIQGVNALHGNYDQYPFNELMYNGMTYLHPQDNPSKWGKLVPDLYVFTLPGYIGRYVENYSDGSIIQLSRDADYRINNDYYGTGEKEVVTPEGIKNYYSRISVSKVYGETDLQSETFSLNKTKYPNGAIIQYDYKTVSYNKVTKSAYRTGSLKGGGDPHGNLFNPSSEVHSNSSHLVLSDVSVKKVSTPNYIIDFVTSARADMSGPVKLDCIVIRNRSDSIAIKKFVLRYGYFYPAEGVDVMDPHAGLRLKLLSVSEVSSVDSSTSINDYSFDYNTVPLPPKDSYSFDHWGYANTSSYLQRGNDLPDISYISYPYLTESDSTRIIGNMSYQVKDARHDAAYCQAGMLTTINYPTGGKTCFEYESNRFAGSVIASKGDVEPDVLTVQDNIYDQNNAADHNSVLFSLAESRLVHIEYVLSKGLNDWSDMVNSKVIYVTSGGSVNEIIGFSEMQQSGDSSSPGIIRGEKVVQVPAGSVRFIAVLPDSLGDQNGANLGHANLQVRVWYKDIDASILLQREDESYGCGMRIKAISHYDNASSINPVKVQRYSYSQPGSFSTSGILFDYPVYHKLFPNTQYCYRQIHNPIGVFFVSANQFQVFDSPVSDNPYQYCSGVGYSCVTEAVDGIPGEKVYMYYNTPAETHSSQNYRITSPLNGRLHEERAVNSSGQTVQSRIYSYCDSISAFDNGVLLVNNLNRFPDLINTFNSFWNNIDFSVNHVGYNENVFSILRFALNQHDITLSSVTDHCDGVTKTTQYTYDSHLLRVSESFQNSDEATINIRYSHPSDFSFGNYSALSADHILSPLVESRVYREDKLVDSHLMELDIKGKPEKEFYGEIGPSTSATIPAFVSNNPNASLYPVSSISYDIRDQRGNPIECTLGEMDSVVYIWSYGYRYPVAKITGAGIADIEQALGFPVASFSSQNSPGSVLDSLQTTLPHALIERYNYNSLGDITRIQSANGYSRYFQYDFFGRLIGVSKGADSQIQLTDAFSYGADSLAHIQYLTPDGLSYIKDIDFFNGLGLKDQSVKVGYTPSGRTSAIPYAYDAALRENRKYLPFDFIDSREYRTPGLITSLQNRYQYRDGESRPYSHIEFEEAPTDRVVREYNTGAVFVSADKPRRTVNTCNGTGEVLKMSVSDAGMLIVNGYYPDSTLYVSKVIDPDGKQKATYTDKARNVILEREYLGPANYCDTYYVYDDRMLLRAILPPNFSHSCSVSTIKALSSSDVLDNCYVYEYDNRRRLTCKIKPGVGIEYFEYDDRDRMVASQSAYDRNHGYKMRYTYDSSNRLVGRCKEVSGNSLTPDCQQVYDSYPDMSEDLAFSPIAGIVSSSDLATNIGGKLAFESVSDLATSGQTPPSFERRSHYYDAEGREIQRVTKTVRGDLSRVSWKYDYVGNVLIEEESVPGNTLRTIYAYDHRNRVTSDTTYVNGTRIGYSSYEYDVFGRMTGINHSTGVEESFSYNYQNWPTCHSVALSTGNVLQEELHYYDQNMGAEVRYSGDLSSYSTFSGETYLCSYDKLGRLTNCTNGSSFGLVHDTEKDISYDRNGNILSLKRYVGRRLSDNLSFDYEGNHRNVYAYDDMGNITSGLGAGISCTYNRLNLPETIIDSLSSVTASYSYLSDGTKTGVRLSDGTGIRYIGSARFRERGNSVVFMDMAFTHGRFEKMRTSYIPYYYSKSHVGSVGIVTNSLGSIVSTHDYLPFGTETPLPILPTNLFSGSLDYRYNGKEGQPLLQVLDYGARFYHPQAAIWISVDPDAERHPNVSPYVFCNNNPLRYVDIDGRDWRDKVAGYAIGTVTNIIPFSGSLRDLYTPNDVEDYNTALKQTDVGALVVGGGMIAGGQAGLGAGTAIVVGGVSTSSTLVMAPEGLLVAGSGAVVIAGSEALSAMGVMLSVNSVENSSRGYNRGKTENDVSGNNKPKTTSQMKRDVEKGRAPKTITRVDRGKNGGQDHVHFSDGKALNEDGSVHDQINGKHFLSKTERAFLNKYGWFKE